jgi:hypothetical protein
VPKIRPHRECSPDREICNEKIDKIHDIKIRQKPFQVDTNKTTLTRYCLDAGNYWVQAI